MARIGEMKCWNPNCSCADVAVHQTTGGKLSGKCHKCQFEHWGPIGTKAQRDMRSLMTADDETDKPTLSPALEPEPQRVPKAPTPTLPKRRPVNSAFDLSQLS